MNGAAEFTTHDLGSQCMKAAAGFFSQIQRLILPSFKKEFCGTSSSGKELCRQVVSKCYVRNVVVMVSLENNFWKVAT